MFRTGLAVLLSLLHASAPSPSPDERSRVMADEAAWEARGFDCDTVTTQEMRRRLRKAGVDIRGLDVDHIVPRSRGGANHPSNYRLLDSHVNRSIQARWDWAKCADVGAQCAEAVAVSRVCGTYRGSIP